MPVQIETHRDIYRDEVVYTARFSASYIASKRRDEFNTIELIDFMFDIMHKEFGHLLVVPQETLKQYVSKCLKEGKKPNYADFKCKSEREEVTGLDTGSANVSDPLEPTRTNSMRDYGRDWRRYQDDFYGPGSSPFQYRMQEPREIQDSLRYVPAGIQPRSRLEEISRPYFATRRPPSTSFSDFTDRACANHQDEPQEAPRSR